ncbi:hypothetical protein CW749_02775 [Vibrio sp. vnigr-6D03]|uniref:hypothetical protein n=1 Tax=Vibrio sp. vnigr-6D03 TaxID=2058088 RepID=UPI000C3261BD|nr:hypothetical protein [Vibrio sp. vnigr-6D03]PKF81576.1 hypothetical protein CW749_02775 [Vibrio sp. vnigr-6D03]
MHKIIMALCLVSGLTACSQAESEQTNNQFSVLNGVLHFNQKFVDDWNEEDAIPRCLKCRKESQIKHQPDGPEIFDRYVDANGLQFLTAKNIRHTFDIALAENSVTLSFKLIDGKVFISIDNENDTLITTDQKQVFNHLNHQLSFRFTDVYRPKEVPTHLSNEQPEFSVDFQLNVSKL